MGLMPRIRIEVYGGCVTEVTGLPEGWEYEIVDHDHLEEQEATSQPSHKPQASQGTRVGPPKNDQAPSSKNRVDRSPDLG